MSLIWDGQFHPDHQRFTAVNRPTPAQEGSTMTIAVWDIDTDTDTDTELSPREVGYTEGHDTEGEPSNASTYPYIEERIAYYQGFTRGRLDAVIAQHTR